MSGKPYILIMTCLMIAILFAAFDVFKCNVYADSTIFTVSDYEVDADEKNFSLDFQDGVIVKEVKSSNSKVVAVGFGYSYSDEIDNDKYDSFVYLNVKGPGTAMITAKDSNGNTDTCKITVKPESFVLSESELILNDYISDYDVYVASETNTIKSVSSSNTNIVKVKLYVDSNDFKVTPVSAGSAVLTVKDVYNQIVAIPVEITQKYVDEYTYLPSMKDACKYTEMNYRDKVLEFSTDISSKFKSVKIQAQIGKKTYTAKYYGYNDWTGYCFQIRNIPVMSPGTEIVCTLTKGEAQYVYKTKIKSGTLDSSGLLWLGNNEYSPVETLVYTGKKRTPSTHVDYGFFSVGSDNEYEYKYYALKKGVDYKATYANNLDVGTAKVTATGIGNYTKSTSETFKIIPKGTSLTKLTAKKKAFTVNWKKQAAKMSKSRITGYQIRYSTKSSMSGAKSVKVKGYANTSKTISKLKKKTKYYVQIRTYKVVKGKTYYSKWSAKKAIKTRK